MPNKASPSWEIDRLGFRGFIVILLILGIFFRFANIDNKVYWEDETYSSLRIAGYTAETVIQDLYNGQEIGVSDLQNYQYPSAETGWPDTVKALAGNPEHSPLYYLLARFFIDNFGYSVALMRGLAALISLIAFPCVYWLCLELFESSLTGWIAVAIVSVSPFQILYAQEARQYSLFIVTIFLASASILRAIRRNSKLDWGLYAATIALGIYSHLLFALVMVSHGIYLAFTERFRLTKRVAAFCVASVMGVLAFLPWLIVVVSNYQKIEKATSWTSQSISVLSLLISWVGNLTRLFFDLNVGSEASLAQLLPLVLPMLLILATIGYSLYFLWHRTPQRVWLFIVSLIGVTALFLIIPDILSGGQRSTVPRYLITCYLGIELAVAYLFAAKISSLNVKKVLHQKMWQMGLILLLSGGVLSAAIALPAKVWWNKGGEAASYPDLVAVVNRTQKPLVISDDLAVGRLLSLSYLLDDKVVFQLVKKGESVNVATGYSDVFLYNPSPGLRAKLKQEQNYQIAPVEEIGKFQEKLWRVEKDGKI